MRLWSSKEWAERVKGDDNRATVRHALEALGYTFEGFSNGIPRLRESVAQDRLQAIVVDALSDSSVLPDVTTGPVETSITVDTASIFSPPEGSRSSGAGENAVSPPAIDTPLPEAVSVEPETITLQTGSTSSPKWKRKQKRTVCEERFAKQGWTFVGWDGNRPIFDGEFDEAKARKLMTSGG